MMTMAQQSDHNFMMMAAGISERPVELWAAMVHDVRTGSTVTDYTTFYLQANLMMGTEGQSDMSDGLSYLTRPVRTTMPAFNPLTARTVQGWTDLLSPSTLKATLWT